MDVIDQCNTDNILQDAGSCTSASNFVKDIALKLFRNHFDHYKYNHGHLNAFKCKHKIRMMTYQYMMGEQDENHCFCSQTK